MISLTRTLLLIITSNVLIISSSSQGNCISEHFLNKDNLVFSCDFKGTNENLKKLDNKSQCVNFIGLPGMKVCGQIGFRYNIYSNEVNSSISLRYYSNKYQFIEMEGQYGWNHWTKSICADFQLGMSLYVEAAMNIKLDRFLLFINPKEVNGTPNHSVTRSELNPCSDEDKRQISTCNSDIRYFGWKVTAIILIIVTIGSLILVISLSVTMPYNVWDKPKIQKLPVRLRDGMIP